MRHLTFKGYLESYVQYLAGVETLALPRLAALVQTEPRLAEPLLLWAVVTGRDARLSKLLEERSNLQRELWVLARLYENGSLESALASEDEDLRPEFHKVWRSYVVRRDAHTRDARLKLEARKRVLELERSKGVSRYRMAKDLELNPGNLHAFLAQGNAAKLSLDRALDLVDYLEAA
jgi:hypothetical protein